MIKTHYLRQLICALLVTVCSAFMCGCNNNGEYRPDVPITPILEFPQYSATESEGSPIAFDSPTSAVCYIINSREELEALVPREVLDADPAYGAIDFSTQTLLSVRFFTYFDLLSVNYKIFLVGGNDVLAISITTKNNDHEIVEKTYHMGNILVRKFPSDTSYGIFFG